jgi:hypothetical protein
VCSGRRPFRRASGPVARWFHAHWRGVVAGFLAGGGTAAGVVAGLSTTHDRLPWLVGTGACAGLAVLVSLLPTRHPLRHERPSEMDAQVDLHRSNGPAPGPTLSSPLREIRTWTIPPPVRSFTGRADLLDAIHVQLTREGATALVPTTALYGMGGIGKTQLALAYARRYRQDYRLGWWVPADSELSITTALAQLGSV